MGVLARKMCRNSRRLKLPFLSLTTISTNTVSHPRVVPFFLPRQDLGLVYDDDNLLLLPPADMDHPVGPSRLDEKTEKQTRETRREAPRRKAGTRTYV